MRTTRPGGQVIVSTGRSSVGEAVLRVRDSGDGSSGDGLNEEAAEGAPEAASRSGTSAGEASAFAHTKALAEANQAQFTVHRKPYQGSLFEVAFLTLPEGAAASPDHRAARDDAFVKPVDGTR
jgi:hypothetical protein